MYLMKRALSLFSIKSAKTCCLGREHSFGRRSSGLAEFLALSEEVLRITTNYQVAYDTVSKLVNGL